MKDLSFLKQKKDKQKHTRYMLNYYKSNESANIRTSKNTGHYSHICYLITKVISSSNIKLKNQNIKTFFSFAKREHQNMQLCLIVTESQRLSDKNLKACPRFT